MCYYFNNNVLNIYFLQSLLIFLNIFVLFLYFIILIMLSAFDSFFMYLIMI